MKSAEYMERIRSMVFEAIGDKPIRVFLFGSRAGEKHRANSDVDLALLGPGRLDSAWLARLRDRLEESTVPYCVDLVDMNDVNENFRKAVLPGALEWKRLPLESSI